MSQEERMLVAFAFVCLCVAIYSVFMYVRNEVYKLERNIRYVDEGKAGQLGLEFARNMTVENQAKLDALLEHLELKTEPVNRKLKVVKK